MDFIIEVLSSVFSLFFIIALTTNIDPAYLAVLKMEIIRVLLIKLLNLEILISLIILY